MAHANGEILQRPRQLIASPGHPEPTKLGPKDRNAKHVGLRKVDQRRGRGSQVIDKPERRQVLHPLRTGWVHHKLMLLLDLVHNLGGAYRVFCCLRLMLGLLNVLRHLGAIFKPGHLVGAMEHLASEGSQCVLVVALPVLPVLELLAHRHFRHGVDVTLPNLILHRIRNLGATQDLVNVSNEAGINGLLELF